MGFGSRSGRGKFFAPPISGRYGAAQISSIKAFRLPLLLFSLFLGAIVCSLFITIFRVISPSDFQGLGHGSVIIEVNQGDTASSLTQTLIDKGVIKSSRHYRAAMSEEPKLRQLQPGFYQLREEMSAPNAVARFVDPTARVGHLDLPNGAGLNDIHPVHGTPVIGIYSAISAASCLEIDGSTHCVSAQELRDVVARATPEEIGVPSWAKQPVNALGNDPRRIEGLIGSGNQNFDPSKTPKEIITHLIKRSTKEYERIGILDKTQSGHSPYEVLISASLLEREAHPEDFSKVARVIDNRLAKGMKLQFDSTVNYGLADQEVATTWRDRLRITKWNTYAIAGLPATPISSPSTEAIWAVEEPTPGRWLYFVTVDKHGNTRFNESFEGHRRDIEEARKNGVLDSRR